MIVYELTVRPLETWWHNVSEWFFKQLFQEPSPGHSTNSETLLAPWSMGLQQYTFPSQHGLGSTNIQVRKIMGCRTRKPIGLDWFGKPVWFFSIILPLILKTSTINMHKPQFLGSQTSQKPNGSIVVWWMLGRFTLHSFVNYHRHNNLGIYMRSYTNLLAI